MNSAVVLIIILAVLAVTVAAFLALRSRTRAGSVRPPAAETPVSAVTTPGVAKGAGLGAKVRALFSGDVTEQDRWARLEEILVRADVGPAGSRDLVERLKRRYHDGDDVEALLVDEVADVMGGDTALDVGSVKPGIVMIVGVNGSGKTTTIGKLSRRMSSEGKTVTLAASDTFRAAAGEQLETWAERTGADIVAAERGADPGAVAFDAVKHGMDTGADVVLIDTAGRLHTKTPLMEELVKVRRVVEKAAGREPDEVLLVLDGTTGQNGIAQARAFTDAVGVTGVVLTKMDGSAKGGIVLAVREELGVVVKLVGTGESADDLASFDAGRFADDLVRG